MILNKYISLCENNMKPHILSKSTGQEDSSAVSILAIIIEIAFSYRSRGGLECPYRKSMAVSICALSNVSDRLCFPRTCPRALQRRQRCGVLFVY